MPSAKKRGIGCENVRRKPKVERLDMTFKSDFFTSLEPLEEEHFVKIADDKILPATSVGKITILEDIEGQIEEREMQNVLLVPGLKRNLISIGTVNDKKISFHCYEHKCKICDSDGMLTSRRVRHGKLFRMLFKMPVQCNVACRETSTKKAC